MGYIDDEGNFQFLPGFGRGLEGMPYDAKFPQGAFGPLSSGQRTRLGGALPYWTLDRARRADVLLVFFERRANKSKKVPPGDFDKRMNDVRTKLEDQRQREMQRLDGRHNKKSSKRLRHLKATGPFTEWAVAVLTDYFFDVADDTHGQMQSWDAGQCAWRHGGVEKIFVKQLIFAVDEIGNELYPQPEGWMPQARDPETTPETVPDDLLNTRDEF